jgi:hypothetical protein
MVVVLGHYALIHFLPSKREVMLLSLNEETEAQDRN